MKDEMTKQHPRWYVGVLYSFGTVCFVVGYLILMRYDKFHATPMTVPARLADFILNLAPGLVIPGIIAFAVGKKTKNWRKVNLGFAIWWGCYWLVDLFTIIQAYVWYRL
jgi:hypothetical protein